MILTLLEVERITVAAEGRGGPGGTEIPPDPEGTRQNTRGCLDGIRETMNQNPPTGHHHEKAKE